MATQLQTHEVDKNAWLQLFKERWKQGEHVAIVGPTGTGKTTVALDVLAVREYVCVLAVKRKDDTLELFKKQGYTVIRKWPPEYNAHRVIFWNKPRSLTDDLHKQSFAVHEALNKMYIAGGWCIYFDEAGYIAGNLKLSRDIGTLLNQGRSANLSIVATMTRPSSVIAQVPKEALNQPRHKLMFKFVDEREIKACAAIAGIDWKQMLELMKELGKHDFVYISENELLLVRNTKGK